MRTNTVTIGETTYTIGKLSCGQVDEIIFANFEIKQERTQIVAVIQGTKRAVRDRICPAIAASLNNASQGNAKWFLNGWTKPDIATTWSTPEDIFTDIDYSEMVQLYEEVTALSELKTKVEKGKAPQGEETAVGAPASS